MLTFNEQFNTVDTQIKEYKSQKQTFKCFRTFEEPFNRSEVYSFIKQYINYQKNIHYNTCKIITAFACQSNGSRHEIYFLSTDELGNEIKKEKYTEDSEVSPPFDIFIQVETINIPIRFTQNTAERVLRPTFKIKNEYSPRTHDGTVRKRLSFYTKRVESGGLTRREIYNLCVPFLTNFQCLYKKDRLYGDQITKSCYEIVLTYNEREEESIYYCEIDTDGDYLEESKIYNLNYQIILKPYKIKLIIYLIYDPRQQQETEYNTQEEIEELESRLINLRDELKIYQNKAKTTNKCTKQETCCICLSNPPNIILTDCGHICICKSCNEKLIELKCPMCRTLITQPRLII